MSEPTLVNRMTVVLQPTEAYLAWTTTCPDADPDMTLKKAIYHA